MLGDSEFFVFFQYHMKKHVIYVYDLFSIFVNLELLCSVENLNLTITADDTQHTWSVNRLIKKNEEKPWLCELTAQIWWLHDNKLYLQFR